MRVSPRMRLVDRLRPHAWIALVACGALVPALAILATGHTLAWRDTVRLFAPIRSLVEPAVRALRLPWWNPHEALGMPLHAQMMHGVLHPVSLAAAILAPGASTDALVVAYVALGAVGAALLARTLGASRGAAAAAGLAYGLSGYLLGMSAVLMYLAAGATAPWTVAALARAGGGRRRDVVLGALATAVQHFAGDPQWTIVAAALGAVLAAQRAGARGVARAVAALGLGTLLAGVQLAPAWAFLRETTRASGLSAAERAQWSLAPWRLVELVSPGFFGRPGPAVWPVFEWLGGSSDPHVRIPFVPSVFVGAAVIAFAVTAARAQWALAVAAVACAWLALGARADADQALGWLPIWGAFRYAEKLVGPLTLCLSALCAAGLDAVAARPSRRWTLATGIGAVLALAAAGALALGFGFSTPRGDALRAVAAPLANAQLAVGLGEAGGALFALAALAAAATRWPAVRARFPAAGALVVFLAGLAAAPYALHAGVPGARDPRPLQRLAAAGFTRIATPLDGGPFELDETVDDADGFVIVQSRMGVEPYAVPSRVDHVNAYTGLAPRRLLELGDALAPLGAERWIALRRYAVDHVVLSPALTPEAATTARAAAVGGEPVLSDPGHGITVFFVPHRPWATFAERVLPVATEREAFPAVVAAERRGDPAVILEGEAPPLLSRGEVLGFSREPERIRIEAIAPGPGLLVVNDAFWPGWSATIDGRPVPVRRADGIVRAVAWPPGRHVLEMRYEPPERTVGLALTGLGALAVLALAVSGWRRAHAASI
jgi:hypothetical protein